MKGMTLGEETFSLASVRGVKEQLSVLGQSARKGLGQHFLVDVGALSRMVDAAEIDSEDLVIEVGPGLGVLTRLLAKRAGKVVAVELDAELAQYLRDQLRGVPNIDVLEGDILDVDLVGLVNQRVRQGEGFRHYKVVAALPYFIAAPVLRRFLEASLKPQLIVVTVQREMAEIIVAKPGDMSLLSVAVQLYGEPTVIDYLSPSSFYPRPKVESAILRIDVYSEPAVSVINPILFFKVVKAGFSGRRKQLHNALAHGLGEHPSKCALWLRSGGIDPSRRAQTLTLEEWSRLHVIMAESLQLSQTAHVDLPSAR